MTDISAAEKNETLSAGEPQDIPEHMHDLVVKAWRKGDKITVGGVVWTIMSAADFIRVKTPTGQMNVRPDDLAQLIANDAPAPEYLLVAKSEYEKLVEDAQRLRDERAQIEEQLKDMTAEVNFTDERLAALEALMEDTPRADLALEREQLITHDAQEKPINAQYLIMRRQGWRRIAEWMFATMCDGVPTVGHTMVLEREVTPSGKPFLRNSRSAVDQAWDHLALLDGEPRTQERRIVISEAGRPIVPGAVPTPAEMDMIAMRRAAEALVGYEPRFTPLDSQEIVAVNPDALSVNQSPADSSQE